MTERNDKADELASLLHSREVAALLAKRGLTMQCSLHDASGQPPSEAACTELIELLRSAHTKLEQSQRLATVGVLAAGMAHEARNLLTGCLGFAQLLSSKQQDADSARDMARTIEQETRRCVGLLAGFLKLSQSHIEARRELNVEEIVSPVERLLCHPLHQRGCTLLVDLASRTPDVFGCASELQRVLINLILNAADATQSGGHIILSSQTAADGCVEIHVSDNGPGVPPELAERIFEPFFSTKQSADGTGLGLSLSRSIAEAHRGKLVLQPSVQGGATFTLRLPAATTSSSAGGHGPRGALP